MNSQESIILRPGDSFEDYKVIKLLGVGGVGQVYLCCHNVTRQFDAVKVIPSADNGVHQRFLNEVRNAAALKHPGIVSVNNNAGVRDGFCFYTMEFVGADNTQDCWSLQDAQKQAIGGRIAPSVLSGIISQICSAIGYAHGKGVMHLDLKPSNILLTSKDLGKAMVKINDFGISKSIFDTFDVDYDPTLAISEEHKDAMGTIRFMSPEQARGDALTAKSDIYSIGAVAYILLTGAGAQGLAETPSQVLKGIDKRWDDLVNGCLKVDPVDRFASVQEIQRLLEKIGSSSVKADFAQYGKPLKQFLPTAFVVIGVIVVMLLVASLVKSCSGTQTRSRPNIIDVPVGPAGFGK